MASYYSSLEVAAPIEVFHVNKLYIEDKDPKKVNLSVGAYRTEEGKPWVLPVVREAERRLALDETQNHEYLPQLGFEPFTQAAMKLALGDDNPVIKEGKAFGAQCLSGTGSLRAGAEFLCRNVGLSIVYVSKPTWGNHKLVFRNAGFKEIREYRYWDQKQRCIDFNAFLQDLEAAPERSVILLHGCAHNPTGMDPTKEQWTKLGEVIKRKNLFPFFDLAYQGFASGDLESDSWAIKHFVEQGHELLIAQSYAKNFGLYNERVGNLCFVVNDAAVVPAIKSQFSLIVRANWSNPPNHGAKVVNMILNDPSMRQQWMDCIKMMSGRIKEMRSALKERLIQLGTPGNWDHITTQIGMFSYTGLTPQQCEYLTKQHKVFLLKDGRINVCGLNSHNVDHVANSIHDTVKNVSHL